MRPFLTNTTTTVTAGGFVWTGFWFPDRDTTSPDTTMWSSSCGATVLVFNRSGIVSRGRVEDG